MTDRTTAIYRAKALYHLATRYGRYKDSHGKITANEQSGWTATLTGWKIELRANGALEKAART